jgi:hypothetical protein
VYFVWVFYYRDKKVVGVFIAFSCAASPEGFLISDIAFEGTVLGYRGFRSKRRVIT